MAVKPESAAALARAAQAEKARRYLEPFCELVDPKYDTRAYRRKIIEYLEAIERREIDRLMVFIRSQVGKSYLCSQMFPAWFMGRHPSKSVMLASYSLELAKRNSGQIQRAFMAENWPFEAQIAKGSSALDYWRTTQGGELIAAGVEGRATGYGADLAIIDDPIADRLAASSDTQRESLWQWYEDVLRTRLRGGSAAILTMTRWSHDDLAARILDSPEGKRWTVLRLPLFCDEDDDPLGRQIGEMLDCDPEPPLTNERTGRTYWALYQQTPLPDTGYTFQREWLENRYDYLPTTMSGYFVLSLDSSWGMSIKSDYSVLQVWYSDYKDLYLVDQWRDRVEYPRLREVVLEYCRYYRPGNVLVEKAASGFALIQEFQEDTGLPIVPVTPVGSKEARAEMATFWFESGRVKLPRSAPWLDEYIREMLRFPAAKHDDQVDATTQAVNKIAEHNRRADMHSKWSDNVQKTVIDWRARFS